MYMTICPSPETVQKNVADIRRRVEEAARSCGRDPREITVMAVTKTVEPPAINEAIRQGATLLGENKVQEYLDKREQYLPATVHFIGNLQTNKVKYIIDKVAMIQSVSSEKLALEIEKQAAKHNLVMPVLLEVNIGQEETKGGFSPDELYQVLPKLAQMEHLSVQGLMCIPPVENAEQFLQRMEQIFIDIREKNIHNINMSVLSMGMSGDFEAAIRHGSTLVRIGTGLFGKRDYSNK